MHVEQGVSFIFIHLFDDILLFLQKLVLDILKTDFTRKRKLNK